MDPRFDVTFKHVPAAVQAAAETQAAELALLLGRSLTATQMLVAQRRLGEAVVVAWLNGRLVGLTDMLKTATDTRLVKRRPKPQPDKRQLTLFEVLEKEKP